MSLDHRGVSAGVMAARDWERARTLALGLDRLPPIRSARAPWFWCRARTLELRSKWRGLLGLGKGQATAITGGAMGGVAGGVIGLAAKATYDVRKDMRAARLRSPGMTYTTARREMEMESPRAGAGAADPFRRTGSQRSPRAPGGGRSSIDNQLAQTIERAASKSPIGGPESKRFETADSFGGLAGPGPFGKQGSKKTGFADSFERSLPSPRPLSGPGSRRLDAVESFGGLAGAGPLSWQGSKQVAFAGNLEGPPPSPRPLNKQDSPSVEPVQPPKEDNRQGTSKSVAFERR